jgi:PAS domain S-box-containing protein
MPAERPPAAEIRDPVLDGASGAWAWDVAADRLFADARFAQLYGLAPADARAGLATHAFFEPIDPEFRMRVRIAVAGMLHGAEVFHREYRITAADGATRWVSARGGLELDAEGRPALFSGVLTDITERKRVEEQLRVTQTAGGVGSFDYVPGLGTATVSEQFCRLLGLHPSDALPVRTINAVVFPDDPPIVVGVDAVGNQTSANAEFRIRRADTGEVRWIARRGEMKREGSAWGTRFIGVIYDVTAAKAAEEQLRELARTLERRVEERTHERDRLWSLSRDLFLVASLDGVSSAVNPAWTDVFGYRPEDIVGRSIVELLHPDDRERVREAARAFRDAGSVRDLDTRMRGADGTYRWINWNAAVRGEEIYGTGRDVSQRKLLEEQLRQSQKMEAVGQLTGGLAHDFNNMLTGIMGGLDIVRRRIEAGRTDDLQRFIDAAINSADRAAALTHRLLAFSRRQSLDNRAVDVNALIASLEDMLRRTLGEQTRLETVLGEQAGFAWSDANQLESALLNLAINARDAMPDGGVLTISTEMAVIEERDAGRPDDAAPGDYVRVRVRDTGAGMPPDVLTKALEPFFTTKEIGQGTGLGLSMIYGFLRQTGGTIAIDSSAGQGTEISLYLPRMKPETVDSASVTRPEPSAPMGRGETILVVEDDVSVRMLVVDVLQELGYAPLEAAHADAAMAILRHAAVDLLVTDVGLPGLNGRQLAGLAQDLRPGLKVLFMTGYAQDAADRSEFLGPAMTMITKPFAVDLLAQKIREIMTA